MKKSMLWRSALLFALLWLNASAQAYEDELHQQLTFMSAKQLSRCMTTWQVTNLALGTQHDEALSALEMRYVVRANVASAKGNFFGRMFRWNYYDVTRDESQRVIGMFATRFNTRFEEVNAQLRSAPESRDRLEAFGELLSYLQDVSTPSRVVPVYTGRWWAFNMQDRFDRYPIDEARLESLGPTLCNEVAEVGQSLLQEESGAGLKTLLTAAASSTLTAVNAEIPGMPAQWTSFWQPSADNAGADFGDYGSAGNNFGKRVEFRCATPADPKMRCLLLKDDPLYQEFAFTRHRDALRSTMLAMLLVQQQGEL